MAQLFYENLFDQFIDVATFFIYLQLILYCTYMKNQDEYFSIVFLVHYKNNYYLFPNRDN